MLVTVIQSKRADDLLSDIQKCYDASDAFELRLDYLDEIDIKALCELRKKIHKPIIFTLRPDAYPHNEENNLSALMELAVAKPDYVDIEHTVSTSFIDEFHKRHPKIKIIRSYHNFDETPQDLKSHLHQLEHPHCDIYKIVTYATSSHDNLTLLHFLKDHSNEYKIAAHCMGELGIPSRILSPIVGSQLQYVSLDETQTPAPGCLSINTLLTHYQGKNRGQDTKIYALLGDPVEQSPGHIFHNEIFQKSATEAVYVKFKVTNDELPLFLKKIKGLPFNGFSITIPLKRDVIRFIDHFEDDCDSIGAINTVRIENDQLSGLNTDGLGALNALEKIKPVKSKKILIIGAGGSAKAISFEAKKRGGAAIVIINRTLEGLDDASTMGPFDFVINALPTTVDFPITPHFSADAVFMDINYHQPHSRLKSLALAAGCTIVDGYEMYVEQALLQQKYWF